MPAARPRSVARRLMAAAAAVPLLVGALGACGYGSKAPKTGNKVEPKGPKTDGLDAVKIGYFGNVTHATPMVDRQKGFLQKELGGTRVKPYIFNAGPSEIEALNTKTIDIGWIGPSPAINGYVQSHGDNLKIIGGSASGGVSLVVNPKKIKSLKDLKGKRIASPQLGNTQDVALLNYLREKGYQVDPDTGKGEVGVLRQDNKEIPNTFRQGGVDGAWVPEPTASKLVAEGGRTLLDEKQLWKDGKFVITNIVVRKQFLKEHPKAVEAVLRGSVRTNDWTKGHPAEAAQAVNTSLADPKVSGTRLPDQVLNNAFRNVQVTDDPLAATLKDEAQHAVQAGLLKKPDLTGIYDLRLLNKVLKAEGRPPVDAAGLGAQ
ncbi:aliphatic sulfonate ABC transporter substrate-binding protein [Streptomyces olivaceiscleroticus]|uniref:aliphatic sulfonate ABC transporter substrate-binding protein n=1 Tax=Streptomyces olivaceiscleroticus TaxID=68245 RepID=UPI003D156A01